MPTLNPLKSLFIIVRARIVVLPVQASVKVPYSLFFIIFCFAPPLHAEGIKCEQFVHQMAPLTMLSYSYRNIETRRRVPRYDAVDEISNFLVHYSTMAAKSWVEESNRNLITKILQREEDEIKAAFSEILYVSTDPDSCAGIYKLNQFLLRSLIRTERLITEIEEEMKAGPLSTALPYFFNPKTIILSAADEEAFKNTLRSYILTSKYTPTQMKQMVARSKRIIRDGGNERLLEKVLNTYAHAIDPHANYFTPDKWQQFLTDNNERSAGIGIFVERDFSSDYPKIVSLFKDSPAFNLAQKAKENSAIPFVKPSDEIIAISQNGQDFDDISHLNVEQLSFKLSGTKGSSIFLRIQRDGKLLEKSVELVRAEYQAEENVFLKEIYPRTDSEGRNHLMGVIAFKQFKPDTAPEIDDAIEELLRRGAEGIVLDLRNNPGGHLETAASIGDSFIGTGTIAQYKDYAGKLIQFPRFPLPKVNYSGPLVIAINQNSASASELLSGSLQDWKRALIVGSPKSFGKGTVQTTLDESRDERLTGAIIYTEAAYYLPSGHSTQFNGVKSNIVIPMQRFDMVNPAREQGESFYTNALKVENIESKLNEGNPQGESNGWTPLSEQIIEEIKQKSSVRLQNDPQAQKIIAYNEKSIQLSRNPKLSVAEYLAFAEETKNLFPEQFNPQSSEVIDAAQFQAYQPAARVEDREILAISADLISTLNKN